MTPQQDNKEKEILEQLIIGSKASLKIRIRSLKSQIGFLRNKRNMRNCDYKFICNGKQSEGNIICNNCFEYIREKALKLSTTEKDKRIKELEDLYESSKWLADKNFKYWQKDKKQITILKKEIEDMKIIIENYFDDRRSIILGQYIKEDLLNRINSYLKELKPKTGETK